MARETGGMRAASFLAEALEQAHLYLEVRMDAVAAAGMADLLHRRLPGSDLQSIAAIYAHAVVTEDDSFRRWRDGAAVHEREEHRGLGLSADVWLDPAWAATFTPDLAPLRAYGRAVYASTADALATMDDIEADLEAPTKLHLPEHDGESDAIVIREREASTLFALVDNVLLHLSEHTGEIAALLGVQGIKASPW
jgi:hypothetical protein